MDDSNLLFAETHEWAHLDGEVCSIGITRFAVEQLTDIVYVELPDVGRKLSRGEAFGVIESVKAVSDLYAPLAGEVIEVNQPLADDPAVLSEDPYEKGWLIRIRVSGALDTSHLKNKADYETQIASEQH